MEISNERLKEMLNEAFEAGYSGSCDCKDQSIAEIIEKYQSKPEAVADGELRVWKAAELKQLPEGTIFEHSQLGKCKIAKKNNTRYIAFDNPGLAPAAFNVDGYPWNIPMKRIG